jgi:hypothetical protein
MSRGTEALPPQDSGRGNPSEFGPHQFDNGARRIEQGISMGQGSQALHEELHLMRDAAMQNGSFNLQQYKSDVQAIDQKLHQDGFLPHVHLDVDGKGQDIVKRGGADRAGETVSEATGGQPDHGGRHGGRRHGRGGHHGRGGGHNRRGGHSRGGETSPGGDQASEGHEGQVAGGETLNEQEFRPEDRSAAARNGDRLQDPRGDRSQDFRGDRSQDLRGDRSQDLRGDGSANVDPNKDRSARPGEPSLWGPPTISAAGIDKVLRENHSPAAGMGNYIYDKATAAGINPAFALAMYGQESTFGTKGAAVRNNSFGNIKAGSHGFQHYDNLKDGYDHWVEKMSSDAYHGKSLGSLIHKYAPASDGNNERAYASYVAKNMNKWAQMGDEPDRHYA